VKTREREEVRHALGDVNRRIKDRRVAAHGRPNASSQKSEVGGAMIERQHVAIGRRVPGFCYEVQGKTVAEVFMQGEIAMPCAYARPSPGAILRGFRNGEQFDEPLSPTGRRQPNGG
jgi:hypothetical protein